MEDAVIETEERFLSILLTTVTYIPLIDDGPCFFGIFRSTLVNESTRVGEVSGTESFRGRDAFQCTIERTRREPTSMGDGPP